VVIVDSTVWVDYLRGAKNRQTDFLDRELSRQRLAIMDIILCEVLQGVPEENDFQQVLRELERCEIFTAGGEELAIRAARNFRTLRRRGQTVRKTIDCWIATFCLENGHSLLHRDRDFDPFEKFLGLKVVQV
jgi:predicted nucleic acid-binding protein